MRRKCSRSVGPLRPLALPYKGSAASVLTAALLWRCRRRQRAFLYNREERRRVWREEYIDPAAEAAPWRRSTQCGRRLTVAIGSR